jgi:uncharacterized protein YdhG (YjbR/CyaY superfamily)
MKKPRVKRSSRDKGKSTQRSVDEYLASIQEPARSTLNKVRASIRSMVPAEATETISYGMPAFQYKKVLLWYAAFSDHCSLFPTGSVVGKLKDELTGYRVSKGTIHFPVNKPLPAALLRKIVKARLADVESKQRG